MTPEFWTFSGIISSAFFAEHLGFYILSYNWQSSLEVSVLLFITLFLLSYFTVEVRDYKFF